jgi:acyl-CoA thioester hydrolase
VKTSISSIHTPRFIWPVQIYWEDTDAGGVVYHSNYLKFFERARSEWLRHQGVVQTDLAKIHGVVFVVRAVLQHFAKPARMDDQLNVWLAPSSLGRASLSVLQELRRGDEVLNRADIELACVRVNDFVPARIPLYLYELFAREQQT